jgi:hypothetical protein
MASVPSAFGSLVEPGWPSTLPGGPDLTSAFMSAAQLKAQTNAKQQQLMNQLASYALRAQNLEHDREMDQKKFELAQQAQEIRNFSEVNDAKNAAARLAYQYEAMGARNERDKLNYDLRAKKDTDRIVGQQGLARIRNDAHNLGYQEGTQEFRNYVDAHVNEIEGLIPSSELKQTLKPIYKDENANIKAIRTALFQDKANLDADIKKEVWANSKMTGTDPVDRPDLVPDEMTGQDFFGRGGTRTGRKQIKTYNEMTGEETVNYIDATRLQELHNRRMKLIDDEKKLPKYRNDPAMGVYQDETKQLEHDKRIQQAKQAQAAAAAKGQDITIQLKQTLLGMGINPDELDE